ncbi:hypothetical protein QFZ49_006730 [Streptomyces turgidiscabies]|uniref:Ig-like domain-containing protein n=1 Tax=Streptomyces turgidiscabies TaxID=85558 RepID=A0ABU0RXR4_9ACTN|nr:hypothetical protein [Streptomyces turgidiscabies]
MPTEASDERRVGGHAGGGQRGHGQHRGALRGCREVAHELRETLAKSSVPVVRRSARAVMGSVPQTRPIPMSIRPGCSASSVPNCSATTRGEWLGSMTPPEPMRMWVAAEAIRSMSAGGEQLAILGALWCSAIQ